MNKGLNGPRANNQTTPLESIVTINVNSIELGLSYNEKSVYHLLLGILKTPLQKIKLKVLPFLILKYYKSPLNFLFLFFFNKFWNL